MGDARAKAAWIAGVVGVLIVAAGVMWIVSPDRRAPSRSAAKHAIKVETEGPGPAEIQQKSAEAGPAEVQQKNAEALLAKHAAKDESAGLGLAEVQQRNAARVAAGLAEVGRQSSIPGWYWHPAPSSGSHMQALLPAEVADVISTPTPTAAGDVATRTVTATGSGGVSYQLSWAESPVAPADDVAPDALLKSQQEMIASVGGTLVGAQAITINSVPCRAVAATTRQVAIRARICFAGRRLLIAMAAIPASATDAADEDVTRFLKSFEPQF